MSKKDVPAVDIEQVGDMKHYLQGKSTEEIENIINDLHLALDEKKRENVREIYDKLTEDISILGYETIHDFISAAESYGIIKSNRAPRRPIPIRYRSTFNPDDTWTGRGKQPKWLQALLAKGHKIEEFEVPQEEIDAAEQEASEQEAREELKQSSKKPKPKKTTAKKPSAEPTATEETAAPTQEEDVTVAPAQEAEQGEETSDTEKAEQTEPNA